MNEFAQTLEMTVGAVVVAAPAVGWSAADESFFRLTDGAFAPSFLAGAGALLASYDED
jgi:hypothetical protein